MSRRKNKRTTNVPTVETKEERWYSIEKILGRRTSFTGKVEYLIKWRGRSCEENTWEPAERLKWLSLVALYKEFMKKPEPPEPQAKTIKIERSTNNIPSSDGKKKVPDKKKLFMVKVQSKFQCGRLKVPKERENTVVSTENDIFNSNTTLAELTKNHIELNNMNNNSLKSTKKLENTRGINKYKYLPYNNPIECIDLTGPDESHIVSIDLTGPDESHIVSVDFTGPDESHIVTINLTNSIDSKESVISHEDISNSSNECIVLTNSKDSEESVVFHEDEVDLNLSKDIKAVENMNCIELNIDIPFANKKFKKRHI